MTRSNARPAAAVGAYARALLGILALSACWGCEEETKDPEPPPLVLPDDPDPTYDDGHWAVEQRGVALDTEDIPIIVESGNAGLSTARIRDDFGLLVLNTPYVDWRATRCPSSSEAPNVQPRRNAERILGELRDRRGVTKDRIAVNVDLLTPGRRGILHVCFDRGESQARFGSQEHREKVIEAFRDLAGLPDLAYVTVGLELNRYYHLLVEEGGRDPRRVRDDYTNLVTLYREVYAAIKDVNPNIKVGPGISWAVFRGLTVPEIALELELDEQADDLEAVYRAFRRTVQPLLVDSRDNSRTADFLGVTMIPFTSNEPFSGDPAPDPDARPQAVQDILHHFRHLPLVADGLPVVLPRIDWPVTSNAFGNQKGLFLTTLKRAVSHVDVEWAAWRRMSDLQSTVAESNTCASYTRAAEPTLSFPEDFCYAGLVEESGRARPVLDILTTDP